MTETEDALDLLTRFALDASPLAADPGVRLGLYWDTHPGLRLLSVAGCWQAVVPNGRGAHGQDIVTRLSLRDLMDELEGAALPAVPPGSG